MATVQFYWPIKVYEAFVYAEQEQNDALSITLLYALNLLKEGKIELTEKSQSVIITILSLISPFGIVIIFFIF